MTLGRTIARVTLLAASCLALAGCGGRKEKAPEVAESEVRIEEGPAPSGSRAPVVVGTDRVPAEQGPAIERSLLAVGEPGAGVFTGPGGSEIQLTALSGDAGADWMMIVDDASANEMAFFLAEETGGVLRPEGLQTTVAYRGAPLVITAEGDRIRAQGVRDGKPFEFSRRLGDASGDPQSHTGQRPDAATVEARQMAREYVQTWAALRAMRITRDGDELMIATAGADVPVAPPSEAGSRPPERTRGVATAAGAERQGPEPRRYRREREFSGDEESELQESAWGWHAARSDATDTQD